MRRSTRVTTQAAEENTSAHSEKGLLVVIMWNQESSSRIVIHQVAICSQLGRSLT